VNTAHAERLARNESFFRQVNERIRDIAGRHDYVEQEFLCECSDPACTERILLTVREYEDIRSRPARFVLVAGHTAPEIERVVEDDGDHVVIDKVGVAGDIAAELDPRES
jgi:hypothetical protein